MHIAYVLVGVCWMGSVWCDMVCCPLQAEERANRLSTRLEEQTQARRAAQDAAERCAEAEAQVETLRNEVCAVFMGGAGWQDEEGKGYMGHVHEMMCSICIVSVYV